MMMMMNIVVSVLDSWWHLSIDDDCNVVSSIPIDVRMIRYVGAVVWFEYLYH